MKSTSFAFKGRNYPVEINMNVVIKFARERKLKRMSDFANIFIFENANDISFDQLDDILLLMKFAVMEGCRNEGSKFDLSMEDIGIIMTENQSLMGELLGGLEGPETEAEEPEPENPTKPGTD